MSRINLYMLAILALLLGTPGVAHAAKSYDNCTSFISALPAVISTPGIWCLNQNLSSAVASGNIVDVQANNVTLDCNDFSLDGTAAGSSTTARGIFANNRLNLTVRRCDIRGFSTGVHISGNSLTVEDNRFDHNSCYGVYVQASNSTVQRNAVRNIGSARPCDVYGISGVGTVDILDNTVAGVVAASGSNGYAFGIGSIADPGGTIVGNRIRGLAKDGTGRAFAIEADNSETVSNNDLVGDGGADTNGIYCSSANARTKDNVISGFVTGISGCTNNTGNVIKP